MALRCVLDPGMVSLVEATESPVDRKASRSKHRRRAEGTAGPTVRTGRQVSLCNEIRASLGIIKVPEVEYRTDRVRCTPLLGDQGLVIEVFPIHTGAVQRTPRRAGEANEEVPRRQPGRGPANNVSFPVVLVAPVADLAVNPFALERSKYAAQSIMGQRARHKTKKAEGVPLSEKAKDLSFALVGKRRPRSRRGHKGSQNRRFKVRQKEVRPKVLCKVPGASAMNHNAVRVKVPIWGERLRPTSQVRNKDRL